MTAIGSDLTVADTPEWMVQGVAIAFAMAVVHKLVKIERAANKMIP